ncbi:MAG: CRISPR-associated endonuclease Cas3'' [Thermanaerothrix sp.]|uniref:CRISPR-associated endonuclease Cas3'' n=1 Tax=Thermanaerothrix sp. TaxID=2972675 RepID=UPI003C7D487E
MDLYPYQKRVKELLLSGHSVILQAPTGSGKTYAALVPFLYSINHLPTECFPQQCIYSVPMRVLANQFYRAYISIGEKASISVALQTGEFAEDPAFTSDLIFTTVDQTLSSFLGVPYSLSQGQSNLNVGAILGSYLVFDEFHLFPEESTGTLLELLKMVNNITPFLLMTATFSTTMLNRLASWLGAEVVRLGNEEIKYIETQGGEIQRKSREYHVQDTLLTAEDVLQENGRRTLVVCNTVERANNLYDTLVDAGYHPVPFSVIPKSLYQDLRSAQNLQKRWEFLRKGIELLLERMATVPDKRWVMLLHSRFERPHRSLKEEFVQSLWGPQGKHFDNPPNLTVVSTQVVEVGLDVSVDTLHTEIAPSASIFQRAGRCARYPGEHGKVFIYQIPKNKNEELDYSPYLSKNQKDVIQRSWNSLKERDGQVLYFEHEQQVIDETHAIYDEQLLRRIEKNTGAIWENITRAMVFGDMGVRKELIRNNLTTRTVIVCDVPPHHTPFEDTPYRYEGFSLFVGTLRSHFRNLMQLGEQQGLEWVFRYPVSMEGDDETSVIYRWLDVQTEDDFGQSLVFAIHPDLVYYDEEKGLRIGIKNVNAYKSSKAFPIRRDQFDGYCLESYEQHIHKMLDVFEKGPWRRRFLWIANRLESAFNIPKDLLERAVYLALALHDLGKLDKRWQRWASYYQKLVQGREPNFLIAHTEWDPSNPLYQEREKEATRKYPKPKTHAGESAEASARILWEAFGKVQKDLYKATYTAIARHHSPRLDIAGEFKLHQETSQVLEGIFSRIGNRDWAKHLRQERNEEGKLKTERLLSPYPEDCLLRWWLYFIVVRNLRLCDQLSQEKEE